MCYLSRQVAEKSSMLRFVVGPDGAPVEDVAGKLPGRGLYLLPYRSYVAGYLHRSGVRGEAGDQQLARIEQALRQRLLDRLRLARRGGHLGWGMRVVEEYVRGRTKKPERASVTTAEAVEVPRERDAVETSREVGAVAMPGERCPVDGCPVEGMAVVEEGLTEAKDALWFLASDVAVHSREKFERFSRQLARQSAESVMVCTLLDRETLGAVCRGAEVAVVVVQGKKIVASVQQDVGRLQRFLDDEVTLPQGRKRRKNRGVVSAD